jgi:hypothetical protein
MKACRDCKHVHLPDAGGPRCHHPQSFKELEDFFEGRMYTAPLTTNMMRQLGECGPEAKLPRRPHARALADSAATPPGTCPGPDRQTYPQVGEEWRLIFEGPEMKSGRPYQVTLPRQVMPFLDHYIAEVWPTFPGAKQHDVLWIGARGGGPLTPGAISKLIGDRTEAEFGVRISPHRFRHCAASTIAVFAPSEIRIAAGLLHHSSSTHTSGLYFGARHRSEPAVCKDSCRPNTETTNPNSAVNNEKAADHLISRENPMIASKILEPRKDLDPHRCIYKPLFNMPISALVGTPSLSRCAESRGIPKGRKWSNSSFVDTTISGRLVA